MVLVRFLFFTVSSATVSNMAERFWSCSDIRVRGGQGDVVSPRGVRILKQSNTALNVVRLSFSGLLTSSAKIPMKPNWHGLSQKSIVSYNRLPRQFEEEGFSSHRLGIAHHNS